MPTTKPRTFSKALGPGLLFAGAAVGVSHLVQSTRAGALFGLALLFAVVLANVFKYPAFQFGPRYAAATGKSLLEGYRRQGRWALVLYSLLTLGTMFFVQAAVVFTTAGLMKAVLPLDVSATIYALVLTLVCAGLLVIGRYPLLDKITKVVVLVLTVATLVATLVALPSVQWGGAWFPSSAAWLDPASVLLIVGLIGWMPSAIDISVWHSLWTLARRQETQHAPTPKESLLDFNIGYLGTAFLAVCFVLMGAAVMHNRGETFSPAAHKFAEQVIRLYTAQLGDWSAPLIGIAAFGVMFSTTLTVIDGFPRAVSHLVARFRGPEPDGGDDTRTRSMQLAYWTAIGVIGLGSLLIIEEFLSSLKALVVVATVLSFMTSPVLAVLNHRAMFGPEVPDAFRPNTRMRVFSIAGIVFLTGVAAVFAYTLATA